MTGVQTCALPIFNPTTIWRQAFILLIPEGATPSQADVTKTDTMRGAWEEFFHAATGGRGAADTTMSAPISLDLALNQVSFVPGDTLHVDVALANPGPDNAVDVFFGFLLPPSAGNCAGGTAVVFLVDGLTRTAIACLSGPVAAFQPLLRAVVIPGALPPIVVQDFYSLLWNSGIAGGAYTVFVAFTRPGSLDVIAVAVRTLTFFP